MASPLDPKNYKAKPAVLGGCRFLLSKRKNKSITILVCLPLQMT